MTGTCPACGQDLPRPEPVPCPTDRRGLVCLACGCKSSAHTPDGVCLTCVVAKAKESTR